MTAPWEAGTVVVLDGGLSNALEDRGADLDHPWWTARILRDEPELIVDVHRAYFEAGADVATTASYQASIAGFVAAGATRAEAAALIGSSVDLARRARDLATAGAVTDGTAPHHRTRRLLVAASVGPYGAVLPDGGEYRGDYGVSASVLRDFHGPRLEVLASAAPDVIAVETIPDVREAEVLVALLDEVGLPAWWSYTVADGRTRAGQPLDEAFAAIAGSSAVVAAGVNCCPPSDVLDAIGTAVATTGLPGVAYPNRGARWMAGTSTWTADPGPARIAQLAPSWVAAGARLIGGCCQVGVDEIRTLARIAPTLLTDTTT